MTAEPSVFTKIIRGELPCFRVFEDEHTLAFLARESLRPGHTLIVPKVEVDHFFEVPEPYYSAVFRNARAIARAIQRATGCPRVGTVIAGWDIPHFHYHVVPMFEPRDLDPSRAVVRSREESVAMQARIVECLREPDGGAAG